MRSACSWIGFLVGLPTAIAGAVPGVRGAAPGIKLLKPSTRTQDYKSKFLGVLGCDAASRECDRAV